MYIFFIFKSTILVFMLSTTSEYAIRALAFLADLDKGESLLGRELSKQTRIPGNYLAKILVALNKVGIVEASRGPGGGYRLKRSADEIYLFEVLRIFEGESIIPTCILRHNRVCTQKDPCQAHSHWKEVRDAFIYFIEQTTVNMLTQKQNPDPCKDFTD